MNQVFGGISLLFKLRDCLINNYLLLIENGDG